MSLHRQKIPRLVAPDLVDRPSPGTVFTFHQNYDQKKKIHDITEIISFIMNWHYCLSINKQDKSPRY